MKDCLPCPVDVFPLYKTSCSTVVHYDVVEHKPRCAKKCGSIDVFAINRKSCKTLSLNNKACPSSRFTWTPQVDVFPLTRTGCTK